MGIQCCCFCFVLLGGGGVWRGVGREGFLWGVSLSGVGGEKLFFKLLVTIFCVITFFRCCLMSSDVGWHIRDKLRPKREHGSILLYVHGNPEARLRTDSPGRPPQLSHSSWTMRVITTDHWPYLRICSWTNCSLCPFFLSWALHCPFPTPSFPCTVLSLHCPFPTLSFPYTVLFLHCPFPTLCLSAAKSARLNGITTQSWTHHMHCFEDTWHALPHTPSTAFRHLPPNSARFSYATVKGHCLSPHSCPLTRSAPLKVLGTNMTVEAT